MAEKKLQPIIIKRGKKRPHAAHGGAWKIAYADFVTAMMAFFLLMWLLGSTAKGELQGIASYFASPLKVAMQGGDGAGNSSSIIPGGGNDLSRCTDRCGARMPTPRPACARASRTRAPSAPGRMRSASRRCSPRSTR
jgi:chemotaxis protein MotB